MRLCRVGREEDLSGVWGDLAKTPVKQHRSVIHKWVDATADSMDDGLSIIVTPTLVKKIITLEFVLRNRQSLETRGCIRLRLTSITLRNVNGLQK